MENPLRYENGRYTMDFADLREKVRNSRTTMFILCSPHNPVGRVWTREELTELGEICLENNVLVFSDEIHSDLVLSGHKHTPFGMISDEFAAHSITAYSPSKTFNLAGFYTSMAVAPDPVLRSKFCSQMRMNGANCICNPGKVALEAAYTQGEPFLTELLAYVEGNVDLLERFIAEQLPGVRLVRPEGTYMAWIDFRQCGLPIDKINKFLLCRGKVILEYGDWFGSRYSGFERINLACPRQLLQRALDQIKSAFDQELHRS